MHFVSSCVVLHGSDSVFGLVWVQLMPWLVVAFAVAALTAIAMSAIDPAPTQTISMTQLQMVMHQKKLASALKAVQVKLDEEAPAEDPPTPARRRAGFSS